MHACAPCLRPPGSRARKDKGARTTRKSSLGIRARTRQTDDSQAICGLATALEEIGTREADEEADRLYLRFIEEHPSSPMVEQAQKARTAFAHKRLKAGAVGGFRPDVMMYISEALQTFEKLGPQKRQETGLEIAILGRNGLDINDPDGKYTLKALPGKFSGLHLLAIMFTAFRQIDPTMETGASAPSTRQPLRCNRPKLLGKWLSSRGSSLSPSVGRAGE